MRCHWSFLLFVSKAVTVDSEKNSYINNCPYSIQRLKRIIAQKVTNALANTEVVNYNKNNETSVLSSVQNVLCV